MPTTMNSHERVLTALAHQEPDRVPLALWGSYYTLQDQTYFDLLSHLGMDEPVPPFRRYKSRNFNYLDDRILDRLGTDIRYVWLGFTDLGGARPDTLQDAWGVQWARIGPEHHAGRRAVGQRLHRTSGRLRLAGPGAVHTQRRTARPHNQAEVIQ